MNVLRNITLYLLLLMAMVICGTIVIKLYDLLLGLNFENIWVTGFKVGFVAWCLMLIYIYSRHIRNK